jgi:pimeloyl-ACP methyl ester carboxylesterase
MVEIEIMNGCFLRRSGGQIKPKILCLAGFADNSQMFTLLFTTALARDFDVIAVDLPGFGASPRQPEIDTIEKYGTLVAELAQAVSPEAPVGLVGHSIASAIAVAAAHQAPSSISGVFSIEGNLTQDDAYFSGQAADWDDPFGFKEHFLEKIWSNAQSQPILRRYFAAALISDPIAMWELGNDAKKISVDDAVGKTYLNLPVPNLYYWSRDNTPDKTQAFIASTGLNRAQQY